MVANGIFIGFQQRNSDGVGGDLWNNAAPSFGLLIPGNGNHQGGDGGAGGALVFYRVSVGGSDPSAPGRYQFLPGYGTVSVASIEDGFGMVLTVNSAGWDLALTGLEDDAAVPITGGSGTWGAEGINDWAEFNATMRVGFSYQTGTSGGDLTLARILLTKGTIDDDFEIISVVEREDPEDPGTTITWKSVPSANYSIDFSTDPSHWSEVTDGVPSDGDTTAFDHKFLPSYPDLAIAPRLHYRIRLNP